MTTQDRIQPILSHLQAVARERARRAADLDLARRAVAVREYQAARFRATYADLLSAPDTGPAARFFLDELYGTQDFLARDAQFEKIVPTIVRLFSSDVAATVALLAELHALSETLDSRMARAITGTVPIASDDYAQAWCAVGEPALRNRQIECVGLLGQSLIRYTTHPALGRALRMMRLPARAAGLKDLQLFLERGFDTFGSLPDPQGFIRTVQDRERALAQALFAGRPKASQPSNP